MCTDIYCTEKKKKKNILYCTYCIQAMMIMYLQGRYLVQVEQHSNKYEYIYYVFSHAALPKYFYNIFAWKSIT